RNDEGIRARGYRISPFEVESCLVSHPAVLEAAVVEGQDPDRGHIVKAFVVLRPDAVPGEAPRSDLQAFPRRHLAPYKCPRVIEFREALPKTPSAKINRKELREGGR